PRGAPVRLQAVDVNRSGSSDRILLRVKSVSFGGRTYRVATSYVQARGRREGRGPGRRAGLGAVTGAAGGGNARRARGGGHGRGGGGSAGGAWGAGMGAGVAGPTGVGAGSRAGERVRISANTRFRFRLNAPLTVRG